MFGPAGIEGEPIGTVMGIRTRLRKGWLSALAASLAVAIVSLASTPALAQTAPPAAIRPTIDANGVDLFNDTFNVNAPSISMGGNGSGLEFHRVNYGSYWTDVTIGYLNLSGSTMTVSIGPMSDSFTVSGGVYTSTEGNGSTLTYNSTSKIYTYTQADGTIVHFDQNKANELAPYGNTALITDITSPDGEVSTFVYQAVQYCRTYKAGGGGYICTLLGYAYRLSSLTNSFGYQLKLTYNYEFDYDPVAPEVQPDFTQFAFVNGMSGYNLASSASTVQASQSYSTTTIGSDLYYVVTDGLSRQTKYKQWGTAVGAIIRPGSSSPDITLAFTYSSGNYRVQSIATSLGTTSYSSSDVSGTRTVTVTDPLSRVTTYAFNIASQRMTSVTDALSHTTSYTYDSSGRVTRVTMPEGNYVNYTYDARGNVTQERHVSKTAGTPADIVLDSSYDTTCSNPKKCNKPNWTKDALGNQTDYTYNSTHGGVLTVTAPAATGGGTRPQTRYTYTGLQAYYYQSGSIVPSGVTTYRTTGTSTCQTSASCTGAAEESKVGVGYGPQTSGVGNNLLPVSVTRSTGNGSITETTALAYDSVGNLTSVDGPLSGTADKSVYFYDGLRRKTGAISPDPDDGGSSPYLAQRVTYDTPGRPYLVENGTATGQTSTALASMTVTGSQVTTYDAVDHPLTVTSKGSGGAAFALTQTTYDAAGETTCTATRMNTAVYGSLPSSACTLGTEGSLGPDRITKSYYDAVGRNNKSTSAYGTSLASDDFTLTWTNNGQLATAKDAEANLTTYEYDGHDRNYKVRFPVATKGANSSSTTDYEQYGFNANGNVTSFRTRRAETINLTYDNLGRMTVKDVPTRSGLATTHTRDVYYGYDLLGDPTFAKFDSTSGEGISFTYDALGRRLTETQAMDSTSRTISYQYDVANSLTRVTHPDSNYIQYSRRSSGGLLDLKLNGSASLIYPTFDSTGRPYRLSRYQTSSATWAQYTQFSWDAASRLSTLTQNPNSTTYDATSTFTYNPAGQIASRVQSNDTYAWTSAPTVTRSYTSSGLNQYSAVGGTSFSYDTDGNLTSDGTNTYVYDVENRMVTATTGTTTTLRYDPLGRLYEVNNSSAGITRFLYDGSDLVAEYNSSGTLLRRYVHGLGAGDDPLVWFEGSGVADSARRYLYADERGSVVAVTDSNGNVLNVNSYDEYGIPGSGNTGRFQYTGQAWLGEIGMSYYKARMYSPTLGRFMQTDPIGYGDGMNMYRYVHNDPINGVDPSGLKAVWQCDSSGHCGYVDSTTGLPTDPPEGPPITVTGQRVTQDDVVNARPHTDQNRDQSNPPGGNEIVVTAQKPQKEEPALPHPRNPGPNNVIDGCTNVPDLFPRSCAAHDVCYQTPSVPRAQCDRELYENSIVERPDLFEGQILESAARGEVLQPSVTYYWGVRLFGWLFRKTR